MCVGGAGVAFRAAGRAGVRVGVASGAGPHRHVAGALAELYDDRFAPPAHGLWLSQHLPRARLVLRDGEGHLDIYEHLGEMLDVPTEPDTP